MLHLPMRRNLPKPGDTRIPHRRVWVEATGDGAGDEGAALLGQQCQQPLLRPNQRIDSRCLAVEIVGDGALLGKRRLWYVERLQFVRAQLHERRATAKNLQTVCLRR